MSPRGGAVGLALVGLGLATALGMGGGPEAGGPPAAPAFGRDVRPVLESRCTRCHNADKKKGGVDLASVGDERSAAQKRRLWRKVLAQVESGEMPPAGARPLSDAQRGQLVRWLEGAVRAAPLPTLGDPGPAVIRRLTRAEYDNTMRDLLGVTFDSAAEVGMTDDPVGENSFRNLAAALDVSPALMDKYFAAADKVLDRFFATELRSEVDYPILERARIGRERLFSLRPGAWRDPGKTVVEPPGGMPARAAAGKLIAGVARRAYRRPLRPGEEETLLRLYDRATRSGKGHVEAVRLMLKAVLVSPHFLFRIESAPAAPGADKIEHIGDHDLAVRLAYFLWSSMPDDWLFELAEQGLLTGKGPDRPVRLRGTVLGVEAPRDRFDARLADALDGDLQIYYEGPTPDGCWVGLDLLAPRRLSRVRFAARQDQPGRMVGGKFQASNSADFRSGVVDLFTVDRAPPQGLVSREVHCKEKVRYIRYVSPKGSGGNIAEMEVWGILDGPVLEEQVRRMLHDPRARALTDHFAVPWLQIDRLPAARPSTEFFPDFQPEVRKAMYDEAATFFDRLRLDNRDVRELLDADYTYLNEDLAKYYHIPGVQGKEMRRVALRPEDHRGGLLGMGGILALTSHTSRTSPTLRGKWVLDVIFGTPPAPPPPDAGKFADEGKAEKAPRTFREKLQMHATQESCKACHRKLDPLGFALENYNAAGVWRERDGTRPLDNIGVLPTGEKLDGVAGLKRVVLERKDDFVRNMIERLLVYALGRDLEDADDGPVQEVQASVARAGCRFEALIQGVVKAYPFQYRRCGAPTSDNKVMP